MALLYSKSCDHEFSCPDFVLPAVSGEIIKLSDFDNKQALLIIFMCNHCPYVQAIEDRIININNIFKNSNFVMFGICSNNYGDYPDDAPKNLLARSQEKNYGFKYLVDEDQSVAKKFDAQCTPDIYLFDGKRRLYYRGCLDDNWQDESEVKEKYLENAISGLLANKTAPRVQKPAMGCSIKWKS